MGRLGRLLLALVAMSLAASCDRSKTTHAGLFRASAWQLEEGAFPASVEIDSVVPGSGTQPWAAVGMTHGPNGQPLTACFLSSDTRSWTPCPLAPVDLDGEHTRLIGVARIGITIVAGGVAVGALHGNPRPTLWQMPPGGPLAELPLPRERFGGPRIIGFASLTAGPSGGLAVGTWNGVANQAVAQVWLTADGADWERLDSVTAMTSTPDELLRGAAGAVGPRRAVVVGASLRLSRLSDGEDGAIWWSDDKRHWTRADLAEAGAGGPGNQELQVATSLGDGFLAAGSDSTRAAVWWSDEGRTWHRAGSLPGGAGPGATITSLASSGRQSWAAGVVEGRPRLWVSVDRQHWLAEPLAPGTPARGAQRVTMAAGAGKLLVVVQYPDGPHAAVVPLPA